MAVFKRAKAHRVIIWLGILLVCLLLPLDTHGASRDLCKDADNGAACAQAPAALAAGRKAIPRPAAGHKFKFHKIQRIDDESENESEDVNEIDENDESTNGNKPTEDLASNENDDADADADADDEVDDEADDNGEDADAKADADDGPSLIGRIMGIIFTSDGDNATETQTQTQTKTKKQKQKPHPFPNIMNWMQWLTDLTGDAAQDVGKKDKKQTQKSDIDWLTYLKRWPFNSIFPKAPQPEIRRRERSRGDDHEAVTLAAQQQSKGEEYVELLIHSLPAFIGNVSQVKSGECHQQLELLHRQLRAHKLWTLQMLDATGKIGAGLLRGNINQFGDFDQCTQVSTAFKVASGKPTRIYGKYCLAQIEMRSSVSALKEPLHMLHGRALWHAHLRNPKHFAPRYTIANWGICVPHACSAHVVHSIIETSLRPYNDTGIQFHIDVRDEHCTMKQRKNFTKLLSKDNNLAMGIFGIAALGFACLVAITWEHWSWISAKLIRLHGDSTEKPATDAQEIDDADRSEDVQEPAEQDKDERSTAQVEPNSQALHLKLLSAFSPQRTFQSLVSLEAPDVQFPLIHLLRLLATLMIYVNLKYVMAGHLPLTNRDAFVGTVDRYWSLAYRVPLLYSDVLLLLSGFLVAHQLSQEMEQTCRLSFIRNLASKTTRYVPSILAVLGFQTWILPHLGTGPLWNLLVGENARLCEENMWRSALSVQNTDDMEEMCSPLTVQLSLDMQLYFLGALVVWLHFTDPEAGFYLCGAFHAVSVAARYSRTQKEHLAPSLFHGIHVSKFYRTANLIYTSPITRATTYLLGIGAGLLLRSESGSFGIPPRFRRTGWALAMLGVSWCFWSPAPGMSSKFVYKSADAAAYLAWSPLVLGLGMCWSILMTPLDKSAVQRFPNISRAVLLLSRIQIPLQLASYVVVLWNTASVKEPHQFHITDLISLPDIASIVCFAIIVAFLIDYPAQQIGQLMLDYMFTDAVLTTSVESDTGEPNNEGIENVKSDSPEPVESIWPSDTEPEEKNSS